MPGGRASSMTQIVTRFAPSPTGRLHLGHAYSALFGWQIARAGGGRFLLRIEDIDPGRCRPEFEAGILEDLAWLGLDWETPVMRQSERLDAYADALETLDTAGLLYPCVCTRKDIRREIVAAGHAPHGPDGPVYPGICRHLSAAESADRMAGGAPYALRLRLDDALDTAGPLRFNDRELGEVTAADRRRRAPLRQARPRGNDSGAARERRRPGIRAGARGFHRSSGLARGQSQRASTVETVALPRAAKNEEHCREKECARGQDGDRLPGGTQQQRYEDPVPNFGVQVALNHGLSRVQARAVDVEPELPGGEHRVVAAEPQPCAEPKGPKPQDQKDPSEPSNRLHAPATPRPAGSRHAIGAKLAWRQPGAPPGRGRRWNVDPRFVGRRRRPLG